MLVDLMTLWDRLFPMRLDWLQVELSGICNAACSYCALNCYKDVWHGDTMDAATFTCLEPVFPRVDLVFLHGWGEPLLHPQLWSTVCKVKSSGTRTGFATNGTLLTPENLARLLDAQVDVLAVSLAGATAATHERFRARCSFTRIESGLKALRREKQASGRNEPDLHIAFILMRSNWREVAELPSLAARWGAKQIVVSNLSLVAREELENESLMLDSGLWSEAQVLLDRAREEAAEDGIGLHYYAPDLSAPQAVCTENVLKSCFVSHRGDVSPCVMANLNVRAGCSPSHRFGGRSHALQRLVFGNVKRESFDDIWHGEAARAFRRAFERRLDEADPGQRHLPEPCRTCYKLYERPT